MKHILNNEELKQLADVIAQVERKTSGEIRLMVVGRSTHTGHVFPLVFLTLISLVLMIVWVERHHLILVTQWWTLPGIFLAVLGVSWFLARRDGIKRWFTPADDMASQVWNRAELEFHREGMSQTSERTGILLFLSLLEHRAVVLGDRAINEKLNESVWREVIEKILEGPRTGQWAAKLEEALRMCGGLLIEHFPVREGDRNELPNHVIVKP